MGYGRHGSRHATSDPTFARAGALTGEGAAIFLRNANRARDADRLANHEDLDVRTRKPRVTRSRLAQRLLMPAAYAETPPRSEAHGRPGRIRASDGLARRAARHASRASTSPCRCRPPRWASPADDRSGECTMRSFSAGPEIEYPTEALDRYGVGAVVAHFGSGRRRRRHVLARSPQRSRPARWPKPSKRRSRKWRVEKDPRSAAGCRIPASYYVNVRFVLR